MININFITFQVTEIKGTTFYSSKHDDVPLETPTNLARNLLITDNSKAFLLNNFLKTYFFRSMAYVSNILSSHQFHKQALSEN